MLFFDVLSLKLAILSLCLTAENHDINWDFEYVVQGVPYCGTFWKKSMLKKEDYFDVRLTGFKEGNVSL